MRSFTIEWLKASRDDLLTIAEIIHHENLTHIVAFHAQQTIEKALKALFEEYEIEVQKTHKLERLNAILTENGYFESLDEDMLRLLDELYIDSRYPGDMGLLPQGKPSAGDAQKFNDFASDIFGRVCKTLDIDEGEIK